MLKPSGNIFIADNESFDSEKNLGYVQKRRICLTSYPTDCRDNGALSDYGMCQTMSKLYAIFKLFLHTSC